MPPGRRGASGRAPPGGSSGARPGKPERLSTPPIASSTGSLATQSRYGPVRPKSLIEMTTSCGWRAADCVDSEAELAQPARRAALHPDVGAGEQREQLVTTPLQVDRDGPLARVAHGKGEAQALVQRGLPPRVSPCRRLHLDDVRAEIAQHPGAQLAARIAELDHAQTIERRGTLSQGRSPRPCAARAARPR